MKNFDLPHLDSKAPIESTDLFKYLISLDKLPDCYIDSFDSWASTYGFIVGEHTTNEETLNTSKHIHDFIFSNWYYYKNTINFGDWFIPCLACDHEAFYIDVGGAHYVQLKGAATDWLNSTDMGLMYDLSPSDYYFKIIGDALYIKYQQIIGGRVIARVR